MKTTLDQRQLAQEIAFDLLDEEVLESDFWTFVCGRIRRRYPSLDGDGWTIEKNVIAKLVRRYAKRFAANDPREQEIACLRQEVRDEENREYWQKLAEECNYTICPIND